MDSDMDIWIEHEFNTFGWDPPYWCFNGLIGTMHHTTVYTLQ